MKRNSAIQCMLRCSGLLGVVFTRCRRLLECGQKIDKKFRCIWHAVTSWPWTFIGWSRDANFGCETLPDYWKQSSIAERSSGVKSPVFWFTRRKMEVYFDTSGLERWICTSYEVRIARTFEMKSKSCAPPSGQDSSNSVYERWRSAFVLAMTSTALYVCSGPSRYCIWRSSQRFRRRCRKLVMPK